MQVEHALRHVETLAEPDPGRANIPQFPENKFPSHFIEEKALRTRLRSWVYVR